MEEFLKNAVTKEGVFTGFFLIVALFALFKGLPMMLRYHKDTLSKLGEDFKESMMSIANTFKEQIEKQEMRWASMDQRLADHGNKLESLRQEVLRKHGQ